MTLPATETASSRFEEMDLWPPEEILGALWEGQMAAVAAVRPALPAIASAVAAALPGLCRGGRLVYCGAGTSGRLAVQDGAELPPTFDWPQDRLVLLLAGGDAAFTRAIENAEDDSSAAAIAEHAVGPDDTVIGVAASGTTPFTLACVREAARRGAVTIGIANSPDSALLAASHHPILAATGAEAIAGSTRMKAGTAQKAILNLFSTLLMIKLGRVYRGMMVDMQARNEKLRRRALRMVAALTGCGEAEASAALAQAAGQVKPAILIARGVPAEEADVLLKAHGGQLRAALAAIGR